MLGVCLFCTKQSRRMWLKTLFGLDEKIICVCTNCVSLMWSNLRSICAKCFCLKMIHSSNKELLTLFFSSTNHDPIICQIPCSLLSSMDAFITPISNALCIICWTPVEKPGFVSRIVCRSIRLVFCVDCLLTLTSLTGSGHIFGSYGRWCAERRTSCM